MDIRTVLGQLQAQTTGMKLERVVNRQVEINNQKREPETPEMSADDLLNGLMEKFKEHVGEMGEISTLAAKIKLFREDVGDDIWNDVKENPSLQAIVEEHVQNVFMKRLDQGTEIILDAISEANSKEDEPLTANDIKQVLFSGI